MAEWKLTPVCCWCGAPFVQVEVHQALAWRCPTAACFDRCARWMDVIDETLFFLPLPKQVELYEAVESLQYRKICWGGQVGGGKSRGLRNLAYRYCRKYPEFNTLMLRRSYLELESSHLIPAARDATKLGAKYSRNRLNFTANGSLLRFGHCDDESDYQIYRSDEYDLIIFDQLETFTDRQFTEIGARTGRVRRIGWRGIVLAGENPGGPGASFVDELFISKTRDRAKYPGYKPEDHLFIPAAMSDNPWLAEGYEDFLADLPEAKREMYRFGRRDVFPGQYFKDFTHPRRVQHLDVPAGYPRVGALHWGYFKPGIMLWVVVLPDGRLYIEREWVFEETIAATVAKFILAETATYLPDPDDPAAALGVSLTQTVGNAIGEHLDAAFGEDVFETLYRAGFAVIRSEHDAVTGWQRLQHWFVVEGDALPALIVDPSCTTLLRTLPQLIQAPTNEEDVDDEGATAAAKALRYLVMSRPQRHAPDAWKPQRDLSTLDDKTRGDIERLRAYEAREAGEMSTISRTDPQWPFGSLRDDGDLDPRLW